VEPRVGCPPIIKAINLINYAPDVERAAAEKGSGATRTLSDALVRRAEFIFALTRHPFSAGAERAGRPPAPDADNPMFATNWRKGRIESTVESPTGDQSIASVALKNFYCSP
jgi:hypothetical protein